MRLITKFNKLIRSRILWGAFAVMISMVFVGFLGPRTGCSDDSSQQPVEGSLFGEDVSPGEFFRARFFELGLRERPDLSEEARLLVRRLAWGRLASLQLADEMGLATSDAELASVIQKDPNFAVNGVFSRERYRAIVANQLRLPEETFEAYLRQNIALEKLANIMRAMVWTSPIELHEKLDDLTASFSIEYTVIQAEDHAADISITTNQAQSFYEENAELFRIPEQASVRYVAFPITNYADGVEVAEVDVIDYYDENMDDFVATDTNGVTVTQSFETVRAEVLSLLEHDATVLRAKDAATEFVINLAPDRSGQAVPMEALARASGLVIHTSELFSADARVAELGVELDFNRTAFQLDAADPDRYFSDAIIGQDHVYVIATHQRTESRIPPLEEVMDDVLPIARQDAERAAFLETCRGIRETVQAGLKEQQSFSDALQPFDLQAVTTTPFTVYSSQGDEFEYADLLVPSILTLPAGELTEVLELPDGALLAYVKQREPGDPASMQLLSPQLAGTLDRYRGGVVFEEWQDYILGQADLKDLRKDVDLDAESSAEDTDTADLPPVDEDAP